MIRHTVTPRADWVKIAEENGFIFHHVNGETYWDESVCYSFTLEQIENDLEGPTQELADMCLELVDEVVASDTLLRMLGLPKATWDMVRDSWQRKEPSLYGRFDFFYDGNGPAKLYEYNADTPTSVYEAAFFQWRWLEDAKKQGIIPADADQFNSIQERLIEAFEGIAQLSNKAHMHFACVSGSNEDLATIWYLRDCATQAGLETSHLFMDEIGTDANNNFIDMQGNPIHWLFKLYPWEFMVRDPYAPHLAACDTMFVEPAWKMVLSNKGILPLLWEKHPGHPNLLPSWFYEPRQKAPHPDYVVKPLFSREGANIRVFRDHKQVLATEGAYGEEGHIAQLLCPPPNIDGVGPVIGSWVVNHLACGIGIREDASPITGDLSRFVPHYIGEGKPF